MPSVRLILSLLFVTALAACGSDDTDGTPPGTGGTGGGGGGGTGGSIEFCGAGVRVLPFDTAAGVLEASLNPSDDRVGSCAPEDSVGNDVVVHFVAAEAGYHRFSTEGTSFDTLLYALRDCTDGFTEVACNNDANGTRQSQILVELEAGEDLFIVVDSVGVKQASPFVLRAGLVEPEAPIIEDAEGFANTALEVPSTAMRIAGRNRDGALRGYEFQLFHTDGSAFFKAPIKGLIADFTPYFQSLGWAYMNVTEGDGTFVVEAAFAFREPEQGTPIPGASAIEIAFIDENDFVSEVVRFDTTVPPTLSRNDACDQRRAFNECPAADACVIRAPATEPACLVATAPTLLTAEALVNLEAERFGLIVTGSDPEADILYARVLPRNATGGALSVGEQGRALLAFHQLGHDDAGNFRGVVSFPAIFNGRCLAPAQAAFDSCRRPCTTQACVDRCLDSANAQLEQCYGETLGMVASIEVELYDETGRLSGMIDAPVTPALPAEDGDSCDPYGAIGICAAGQICWSPAPMEAETCHEEGPLCPEDYGVIDLMEHASGSEWVYRGDHRQGADHGEASCGGGGKSEIFSFTAPAGGTFSITTGSLASGVDTVVSARTYCQLPAYELACNDNAPFNGAASRITRAVEEGETIYIVVDSADDLSGGPYTLTVKRF